MKVFIICGLFVAWTHAASLKTEKRANGGANCVNPATNQVLASGQSYTAADGCNMCKCLNGNIVCTHIVCPGTGTTPAAGRSCVIPATNQLIQTGQSYPALDGCNTCTCSNGVLTCTHKTCGNAGNCLNIANNQAYKNGQTYTAPDGCNTCTCNNGNIVCTQRTCTGPINPGGNCVNPANKQALVNGQSYTASDGCNTCTCMNGNIVCSHIACTTGTGLHIGVGVHPGGNIHTGSTCYDNLQHRFHNDGDTYTSSISATGGCRTCSCAEGILTCGQCNTGTISRTCTDVATNHIYSSGQTVKAADGCNTCTCLNGKFTCTTLPCPLVG